jgi:hypothetical protein
MTRITIIRKNFAPLPDFELLVLRIEHCCLIVELREAAVD